MWFLPRDQWEIVRTWDVAGMRGSGSDDVKTEGGICPAEYAGIDLFVTPAHYDNPVYRMPVPLRLAYNKSAVALGVAKGALEAFSDIAQNKIPMLASKSLAQANCSVQDGRSRSNVSLLQILADGNHGSS